MEDQNLQVAWALFYHLPKSKLPFEFTELRSFIGDFLTSILFKHLISSKFDDLYLGSNVHGNQHPRCDLPRPPLARLQEDSSLKH